MFTGPALAQTLREFKLNVPVLCRASCEAKKKYLGPRHVICCAKELCLAAHFFFSDCDLSFRARERHESRPSPRHFHADEPTHMFIALVGSFVLSEGSPGVPVCV